VGEDAPRLTQQGREGIEEPIVGEKRTAKKAGLEDEFVSILKKFMKCD